MATAENNATVTSIESLVALARTLVDELAEPGSSLPILLGGEAAAAPEVAVDWARLLDRAVRFPLLGWSVQDGQVVADASADGRRWWLVVGADGSLRLQSQAEDGSLTEPSSAEMAALGRLDRWSTHVPSHDELHLRSRRTFGVELEFTARYGLIGTALAALLHQLGVAQSPRVRPNEERHGDDHTADADGWVVEQEGMPGLWEVVSPILRDSPDAWAALATVLGAIRTLGGQPDPRAGGHIHLGADEFSRKPALQDDLVAGFGVFEDLLYRLGTADPDRGHRGVRYAQAVQTGFGTVEPPAARTLRAQRYRSLNLQPLKAADAVEDGLDPKLLPPSVLLALLGTGSPWWFGAAWQSDHIELRYPDASLDLGIIQALVRANQALVDGVLARSIDGSLLGTVVDLMFQPGLSVGLGTNAQLVAEMPEPELARAHDVDVLDAFLRFLDPIDDRVAEQIAALFHRSAWQLERLDPAPSAPASDESDQEGLSGRSVPDLAAARSVSWVSLALRGVDGSPASSSIRTAVTLDRLRAGTQETVAGSDLFASYGRLPVPLAHLPLTGGVRAIALVAPAGADVSTAAVAGRAYLLYVDADGPTLADPVGELSWAELMSRSAAGRVEVTLLRTDDVSRLGSLPWYVGQFLVTPTPTPTPTPTATATATGTDGEAGRIGAIEPDSDTTADSTTRPVAPDPHPFRAESMPAVEPDSKRFTWLAEVLASDPTFAPNPTGERIEVTLAELGLDPALGLAGLVVAL
ncbi:MAG: amidoligase family protein, partial [Phycicoccus sp.]